MKLREFIGRLSFEEKKKEREKKGIENVYKHKIRRHKKKQHSLEHAQGGFHPATPSVPMRGSKVRGGSREEEVHIWRPSCAPRHVIAGSLLWLRRVEGFKVRAAVTGRRCHTDC